MRDAMATFDPSSDGHPPIDLDVYRYRLDAGGEHYVAQQADGERIVATLRLDVVRTAPIAMLRRLGLKVLPDTDGAYAHLAAEPDAAGIAGLAEVMATAYAVRADDPDDGFWLAACPAALTDIASAIGWRMIPQDDAAGRADVPMVLLLDELERFERIDSPLARAAPDRPIRPERLAALLVSLELPVEALGERRAIG